MVNNKCWWCGNLANSREHKIKNTDLSRVYGKGPFKDKEKLFYLMNQKLVPIQSAKSRYIKFKNSLCENCNTSRSAPFDKAYSKFINYVLANFNDIYSLELIDFTKIFKESWLHEKQNVIRYYSKHIGCQMNDYGIPVPLELKEFLNGNSKCDCLNYRFMLREYNKVYSDLSKKDGSKFEQLYIGNRRLYKERQVNGVEKTIFNSWKTIHWFSFDYVIEENIAQRVYEENPIRSNTVKVELLKLENYPSMLNVKGFQELIERIENFDRGYSESEKMAYLQNLRSYNRIV